MFVITVEYDWSGVCPTVCEWHILSIINIISFGVMIVVDIDVILEGSMHTAIPAKRKSGSLSANMPICHVIY